MDGAAFDHGMHLLEGCPLGSVRLTGQQHDPLQGHIRLQAVVIIVGVAVTLRTQQFKAGGVRPDTGFFIKFPGDGLTAALPCLGGAAGVFPGAGKLLPLARRVSKRFPLPS